LPDRPAQAAKRPTVLGIPQVGNYKVKEIHNSSGASQRKVGLGDIVGCFLDEDDKNIDALDDENIKAQKHQGILRDLESTCELIGRYAAIKDEIDVYSRENKGLFIDQVDTLFDRVNAYYHLDYVQRYFRERLGLHLLDNYPHLNPVSVTLAPRSADVARYDPNSRKIIFHQLGPKRFTAARDPRFVYHEFVHVVTDAIARLHRAGQLLTPRAGEALQAQAMDEGMADYFACSLAAQQGTGKAVFYYKKNRSKWTIHRNLDPEPAEKPGPEQIKICELNDCTKWDEKKYQLGERWGRYLWQLRKELGAEIADMLVIHSLFFLTRWATFQQGADALQLADRLLFDAKHEATIAKKYQETMEGIEIVGIPFQTRVNFESSSVVLPSTS
jgi:hypothetical protein